MRFPCVIFKFLHFISRWSGLRLTASSDVFNFQHYVLLVDCYEWIFPGGILFLLGIFSGQFLFALKSLWSLLSFQATFKVPVGGLYLSDSDIAFVVSSYFMPSCSVVCYQGNSFGLLGSARTKKMVYTSFGQIWE
jgi:hypothetical protein